MLHLEHDLPVKQTDLQAAEDRVEDKYRKEKEMRKDEEIVGQLLAQCLPTLIRIGLDYADEVR